MNAPPFTLRRAQAADAQALTALQRAAYAGNREILGVEPLPLLVDYHEIVATKECWLAEQGADLLGALIVEPEGDTLLIWNVSVSPEHQNAHIGRALMAFAEKRAREAGKSCITLYTGQKLTKNVAWYQRLGYRIIRTEVRPDRVVTHMEKPLPAAMKERG